MQGFFNSGSITSGQLADPVFSVGDTVQVSGRRMNEPLQGIVGAAEGQ